jgi:hypothetical protein
VGHDVVQLASDAGALVSRHQLCMEGLLALELGGARLRRLSLIRAHARLGSYRPWPDDEHQCRCHIAGYELPSHQLPQEGQQHQGQAQVAPRRSRLVADGEGDEHEAEDRAEPVVDVDDEVDVGHRTGDH